MGNSVYMAQMEGNYKKKYAVTKMKIITFCHCCHPNAILEGNTLTYCPLKSQIWAILILAEMALDVVF